MARHLFFSGKGGVGKTSLASATAVRLADAGQRALLVTTDPASNLADVFEQEIGPSPRPIATVPGLDAQEIDAEAAARTYRDKALTPLRGLLPEEMLRTVEEQMSGPCTVEIAGFDEFIGCMLDGHYARVVFDTAPTGHTLRLLGLPAAWSVHIEDSARGSGQTCIGPVDQLQTSKEQYDEAMRRLRDGEDTVLRLPAGAHRGPGDAARLTGAGDARDIQPAPVHQRRDSGGGGRAPLLPLAAGDAARGDRRSRGQVPWGGRRGSAAGGRGQRGTDAPRAREVGEFRCPLRPLTGHL